MNQEQLKNLILNEPSKEEIEKLIKVEEQAGQYVKYGLYNEDKNTVKHRCSHENENIKKLYDEFLGKPLGERAHHFLHTEYKANEKYTK